MFFLVEEMESLVTQQRDVRMLREKIVDGSRAGFLDAGDYKIYLFNLAAPKT
jgi:hypothetical protein